MEQLETRELRYFVAVAEELHVGRAAGRLGIAQPPLSRAIQRLERRLGVTLLDRGGRGVALTAAGEVLLREARAALDAVEAAARRTRRAGRPDPGLVLVMKPGGDAGLLPDILDAYRAEPDAVEVEPLVCGICEQAPILREGRADVGFLHLPYDDPAGLDHEPLRTQDQVAILRRDHALAGRPFLALSELDGDPMPRWPGMSTDDASGPLVRDSAQLLQLVALGMTLAVLPESAADRLPAGLVGVPVLDAPPTTVVVAWPRHSRSRPVAAFVRAATAVSAAVPSAAAH
jgi:DNA-binding transcriptional LysR family regulator